MRATSSRRKLPAPLAIPVLTPVPRPGDDILSSLSSAVPLGACEGLDEVEIGKFAVRFVDVPMTRVVADTATVLRSVGVP